ncbi:MAG TPA: 50S ribosomal protein L30 [Clostridiales bacterium]|jgi:large subunit ribosomal protein L30|nr:50S ribosomal protein L30 [Clostridiales bacterium]HRT81873.1 50S ribosomal protein L30 [Oscillospiraceae bacterium]
MADIQVKLVKSLIGSTKVQIATAHALGLRKIGDVTVHPDNAATRGKVNRIIHLVEAEEAVQGGAN